MANIDMVNEKVGWVKEFLGKIDRNCQFSFDDIQKKESAKLITERCLFLLGQSIIDLADTLINCKKLRSPASARESFQILFESILISYEVAEGMKKLVGFRNILSHEYTVMDYTKVYDVLQTAPKQVKEFLEEIDKLNI